MLTAESSEERNRREGGEGGGGRRGIDEGRANGVLLNDDEAEIEAEEKVSPFETVLDCRTPPYSE